MIPILTENEKKERNDNAVDFITYISRANVDLNSEIKESIFETNSLLKEKKVSLIKYSAFFGSIKIFNFLKIKGVELSSSLWIYAIHGGNADIIHCLEENHVEPKDKTFGECLEEAIKCHQNNVAEYIENNLFDLNAEEVKFFEEDEIKFKKNSIAYGIHYNNFVFIPENITTNQFSFYYFCEYDYLKLVKLYVNYGLVDLTKSVIR
ncbi:hypothetical protein M9Y10_031804 [Tritrichomonas musculus]|uniref:DUF3447 domain-containing protein n=1 Tax=Tritrichomonas musculus TaxID=1915356 RepID=A0ABR2H1S9_9EUKA